MQQLKMITGHPTIRAEWITVPPELAAQWVGATINNHNRPIDKERVNLYRDMMLSPGAWLDTGEPIQFAGDPFRQPESATLLNGQHRMAAQAKAGVTLRWLIQWNLDVAAQKAIDRGRARQHRDDEAIAGTASPGETAARIGAIHRMLLGRSGLVTTERYQIIKSKVWTGIRWSLEVLPGNRGPSMSTVAGPLAYIYQLDPVKINEFATRLRTGAGLDENSPILTLRNYVLQRSERNERDERKRGERTREDQLTISLKTLRAAKAYLDGEPLTLLRRTKDALEFFVAKIGDPTRADDDGPPF